VSSGATEEVTTLRRVTPVGDQANVEQVEPQFLELSDDLPQRRLRATDQREPRARAQLVRTERRAQRRAGDSFEGDLVREIRQRMASRVCVVRVVPQT
jgi:hypothetical protein